MLNENINNEMSQEVRFDGEEIVVKILNRKNPRLYSEIDSRDWKY